jgi:hypothetical protein
MARRFGMIVALVGVLSAVAIGPTFADTVTGRANTYLITAGFSFIDGSGHSFQGNASLEDDRLHAVKTVSFYFAGPGDEATCDPGTPDDPSDDYVSTDYLEFDPTSPPVIETSAIADDLATASFGVRMNGVRYRFDACTGELVGQRREHHRFSLHLTATSAATTSVDSVVVDNGDGTFSQGTETFSIRTASGSAHLDRFTPSVDDASIQHVLITVP